ncbi:unnamed protein product [Clonostachys rosea f. rosea IK726]|uniref:Uncharacterized protein n=1 Tax=Clonostachys rosea f. rosea IK726 TaxID=1349383 RepID=A0ACA9UCX5_BIOOC|nr:unnamed protein product [Clonostachys rosea f. rosea IK726]
MTVLTITINNRSQETCSYGYPDVDPNNHTRARGSESSRQATFILSKELIATCGIYDVDYNIPTPPDPKKKPVGTGQK